MWSAQKEGRYAGSRLIPRTRGTPAGQETAVGSIFGSNRSGNWQIWKMPSDGGRAIQITQEEGVPRVGFSGWVCILLWL